MGEFTCKLDDLETLQRGLIWNGVRNLRQGGTLLYSTCSFAKRQNQDVVRNLLEKARAEGCQAEYLPLFDEGASIPCDFLDEEKSMALFSPARSNTSGLFIAKVRRL